MQVLFTFSLLEKEGAMNKRQYDSTGSDNSVFRNLVVESHSVNLSVPGVFLLI